MHQIMCKSFLKDFIAAIHTVNLTLQRLRCTGVFKREYTIKRFITVYNGFMVIDTHFRY